jgi:chromosome partitioning protein
MTPSQGEATEDVGMAVLALASAKGGVGKTTIAVLVGTELALEGYKVTLLDCDLNQHATAFGEKAGIRGFTVVPSVDEANVLSALRRAETDNDVVLIDLPGGSSTLALKALQRSHFVLVPCQASLPDIRDAIKTVAQIDDAQDLSRVKIARSLIWTRVLSGYESRSARHVRESVEAKRLPMFSAQLKELAAFRELHITGQVPQQIDAKSSAALNVSAITTELLANLEKLAVAA